MKKKIGFSIVVAIVFLLLVRIISIEEFLAQTEIKELDELKKFDDRTILLPTYAPFTIHKVEYDELYKGEVKVNENSEIVHVNEGNIDYLTPNLRYVSDGAPRRIIDFYISKGLDRDLINYDEIHKFGNSLKGYYRVFETKQFFIWEQDGVMVDMVIKTEGDKSLLSIEELIKIAESFEEWDDR
ncbi:hypothetical protein [Pontibacillus salipaludis]|uniref:Uncharacterized protein n=1 Tax=Pontibacillus salipaludis TaxID=1697394 RepID=A0ABQ1PZS4_9BACI|nr:hypothetical protein [Pontibacillus salipaludis]GGD08745.1 hypothetical protein GCM10011389_15450 [Pontibacillus salipaludis]